MNTRFGLALTLFAVGLATAVQVQAACWKLITETSCCAWNGRPNTIPCGSNFCTDQIKSDASFDRAVPAGPGTSGEKDQIPKGFSYCEYYPALCKDHQNPPACYWPPTVLTPSCQKTALDGGPCTGS